MVGWILNATRPDESLLLDRVNQQPVYYSDNVPVYEVWFWHSELKLWFVMVADPGRVVPQGAVGFHPLHTREQIKQLIEQWRQHLARTSRVCGNG
jgi:hypothetical protein